MTVAVLGPTEIALGAGLILGSAGFSLALGMGLHRSLLWSALRMAIQLLCVGYLLRLIIRNGSPVLTAVVLLAMVMMAAYEVGARQRKTGRLQDYGLTLVVLSLSAGVVTLIGLAGMGDRSALTDPQRVIPIFGIVLGTAMNSAALTLHTLGTQVVQMRAAIEARLALGHSFAEATADLSRNAIVSGTIPILNQMAGAGVITLPGVLSGQILAGQDPMQAALYQVFLMTLLAVASVVCVALSVWLLRRRISDDRQRLRLERIGA